MSIPRGKSEATRVAEPPATRNDDACCVGETPLPLAAFRRVQTIVGYRIRLPAWRSQSVSQCLQYRVVQHRQATSVLTGGSDGVPTPGKTFSQGAPLGEKDSKIHSRKENGFAERNLGTRLAGTGIRLCFSGAMGCAHTGGGSFSRRSCEGRNVTSHPREDSRAVRAGTPSDMPIESNPCRRCSLSVSRCCSGGLLLHPQMSFGAPTSQAESGRRVFAARSAKIGKSNNLHGLAISRLRGHHHRSPTSPFLDRETKC